MSRVVAVVFFISCASAQVPRSPQDLGALLRQDQENDRALQLFGHALVVRPGDFSVRYQIASVGLAKGELESARRDLEAVVKEAPEFNEAHVSLARIYFRQKKKTVSANGRLC